MVLKGYLAENLLLILMNIQAEGNWLFLELESQARSLSANAIINTRVSYNQFVNSDIMLIVVTASGTAGCC